MTVPTGTGDLYRTARVQAGRALISVSRHLSRAGARLVGHPSVGGRPALRVVTADERAAADAANLHDIARSAL